MIKAIVLVIALIALVGCSSGSVQEQPPEVIVDDPLNIDSPESEDVDFEDFFADDEVIEIGEMI